MFHGKQVFLDTALGGFASFGIIWLLFWLFIVLVGLIMIILISKNNSKHRKYSQAGSAVKILKERFARGEIDEDEYRAKKEILEED